MNRKQALIVIAVIIAVVLFPTPCFTQQPVVLDGNRSLAPGQSINLDWTEPLGNSWKVDADITSTENVTLLVVVTEIGISENKTNTLVNKTRISFGFVLTYGSDAVNNFLVGIRNPRSSTATAMNGSISAIRITEFPTLLVWWME